MLTGLDPEDIPPEVQVETEAMVLFWKPPSPFSQWTVSPFEADGVAYCCAEQMMMAEKARLFGDDEVLARIMDSREPDEHKALGQKVRGFDQVTWERERLDVVVRTSRAKFTSDDDRRAALLATGGKLLVEASPRDRIWGIGLRADDPRAHDPAMWQGLNLLGRALMDVRTELAGHGPG